jgi:hypothetical protein
VPTGPWVSRTKRFAFAATYVMNTWQSWQALHPAGIVLHSVPPVLVYCAAETGPVLRDRLTEAVHRAAAMATTTSAAEAATGQAGAVGQTLRGQANPATPVRRQAPRKATPKPAGGKPAATAGRKLFAEYLADAQAALSPGVVITPAWVRQVTGCSRGLSPRIARALATEVPATEQAAGTAVDTDTDVDSELEGRAA